MVYVFIDTNVYLKFYKFSKETISKLNELKDEVEKGNIILIINEQLKSEFYANRENSIKETYKNIKEFVSFKKIGNCPYTHDSLNKIKNSMDVILKEQEKTLKSFLDDAEAYKLEADKIIEFLFMNGKELNLDKKILEKSKIRVLRRMPPGKEGSHGDAIHWELLKDRLEDDKDLYIISNDGDFKSTLFPNKLNPILEKEWGSRDKKCYIFDHITEFLKHINKNSKINQEDIENESLTLNEDLHKIIVDGFINMVKNDEFTGISESIKEFNNLTNFYNNSGISESIKQINNLTNFYNNSGISESVKQINNLTNFYNNSGINESIKKISDMRNFNKNILSKGIGKNKKIN